MDQCEHCIIRGDFSTCIATECFVHRSWYSEFINTRIEALESENETARKLLSTRVEAQRLSDANARIAELEAKNERLRKANIELAKEHGALLETLFKIDE